MATNESPATAAPRGDRALPAVLATSLVLFSTGTVTRADEIKLDRMLTAGVTTKAATVAIVRHTTALAHDLGLTLVAEGVEDFDTLEVLAGLGCDTAQGFAIAHPMPAHLFVPWLENADFRWVRRRVGDPVPLRLS